MEYRRHLPLYRAESRLKTGDFDQFLPHISHNHLPRLVAGCFIQNVSRRVKKIDCQLEMREVRHQRRVCHPHPEAEVVGGCVDGVGITASVGMDAAHRKEKASPAPLMHKLIWLRHNARTIRQPLLVESLFVVKDYIDVVRLRGWQLVDRITEYSPFIHSFHTQAALRILEFAFGSHPAA